MNALVVYCHPVEGSFCSAMRDAAVSGLRAAGHTVDVIDLAACQFNPVMTTSEWMTYQQVYQTKYQFLELDHRIVVAEKTKYYTGKFSEDEIIARGWEVEGTKILKADLHVWADSDLDIVKSKKSLILLKQLIQLIDKTLDILIDQKKWTIKNYIDYKKFIEGN